MFIDIIYDLITLNLGSNMLPDAWINLSVYDLQSLALLLTVTSDFVDWRKFLQAASQPWPIPTVAELLETLQRFQAVDVDGSGFVTEEQYHKAGLWFKGSEDIVIPESLTEPLPFNRQEHLIKFLFTLFADAEKDPPLLDYTEMLLYFASHPNPVEGVYRALSVATGTHIHRKKERLPHDLSLITDLTDEEDEGADEGAEEEEERDREEEDECFTNEGKISLHTLLRVFQHDTHKAADNNRFSGHLKAEDNYEHFYKIYKDLGSEKLEPIPVALLLKHPYMEDLVLNYQEYALPDFKIILQRAGQTQPVNGENPIS